MAHLYLKKITFKLEFEKLLVSLGTNESRASEVAQPVRASPTKPVNLSLIPGAQVLEGNN